MGLPSWLAQKLPSVAPGRAKRPSPRHKRRIRGSRESLSSQEKVFSHALELGRGSAPQLGRGISPLGREISSLGKATSFQLEMGSFLPLERAISGRDLATFGPCWCCAGRTSSSSSGCRPSCRRGRGCGTARTPPPPRLPRRPRVLSLRSRRHLPRSSPLPHCQTHPEEENVSNCENRK